MSGAVTQLEDMPPFDERKDTEDPVHPASQRYGRSDEIVGKCEGMIEQVKDYLHDFANKHDHPLRAYIRPLRNRPAKQNKGLTVQPNPFRSEN
jgi:hypothetical protein